MQRDETAHHTVTPSGCNSVSWSICGLEALHIRQLCLFMLPFKSKWASSDMKRQFNMFPTSSTIWSIFWQNSKRIGKSAAFSLLAIWILYGNKSKFLCIMDCNDCLLTPIWAGKLLVETRGLFCDCFLRSNRRVSMVRSSVDCPMLGKIVYKSHYGPSARRIAAKRAPILS